MKLVFAVIENLFYIYPGFPEHCSQYEGPHSVECLNELWLDAGCLKTAPRYPSTLQRRDPDEVESLRKWNLRWIVKLCISASSNLAPYFRIDRVLFVFRNLMDNILTYLGFNKEALRSVLSEDANLCLLRAETLRNISYIVNR